MRLAVCFLLCVAASAWKHLFTSDCDQSLVMWGDTPSLKSFVKHSNLAQTMYEAISEESAAAAMASCANLTEAAAKELFTFDVETFFNIFDPSRANTYTSQWKQGWGCSDFDIMLGYDSYDIVNLPASCNYARWKAEGKCDAELAYDPAGSGEVALQISLTKCPSASAGQKKLPSISVACKGAGCDTLGKVCSSHNDCSASQKCFGVDAQGLFGNEGAKGIRDFLVKIGIFTEAQTVTSAIDAVNFMGSKVLEWLGFGSNPANIFTISNTVNIGLCGIDTKNSEWFESFIKTDKKVIPNPRAARRLLQTPTAAPTPYYLNQITVTKLRASDGAVARAPIALPAVSVFKQASAKSYFSTGCDGSFRFQLSPVIWLEGKSAFFSNLMPMVVEPSVNNALKIVLGDKSTNGDIAKNFKPYTMEFWAPFVNTDQPSTRNLYNNHSPAVKIFQDMSYEQPCPLQMNSLQGLVVSDADSCTAFQKLVAPLVLRGNPACDYIMRSLDSTLWPSQLCPLKFSDAKVAPLPYNIKGLPSSCDLTINKCGAAVKLDDLFGKATKAMSATAHFQLEQCSNKMPVMYFDCDGGSDPAKDACKLLLHEGVTKMGCVSDSDCPSTHKCADLYEDNVAQNLIGVYADYMESMMRQYCNDPMYQKMIPASVFSVCQKYANPPTKGPGIWARYLKKVLQLPGSVSPRMCVSFVQSSNWDTSFFEGKFKTEKNIVNVQAGFLTSFPQPVTSNAPHQATGVVFAMLTFFFLFN